ncbi:MAG: hypothetical protein GC152_04980 [Alphaproteobacteria bacterium]|nr:hypothetical protein [Alphaproteobacteria bacterium]
MTIATDFGDVRRGPARGPAGEEELRFIRNFHDVFLSIGLALFAVGLGIVTTLIVFEGADLDGVEAVREAGWTLAGAAYLDAAVMWLLAEFFARGRRLFLPAIVILLAFTWFFIVGTAASYVLFFSEEIGEAEDALRQLKAMPWTVGVATTVAILAYYLRMKLPFAMGLAGVSIAATGTFAVGYLAPDLLVSAATAFQFAAGLFLFLLGVAFDARDPARRTRYSDNAFWLHFFAAPLIFSSVMTFVGGGVLPLTQDATSGVGAPAAAIISLVVVIAFAIVSLLINRRALLVAGLLSAAVAIAILIREVGMSGAWTGAVTLLTLGGAMVLLGAGWHAVRRILVAPFPKTGLIARIIPPEPEPGEGLNDE